MVQKTKKSPKSKSPKPSAKPAKKAVVVAKPAPIKKAEKKPVAKPVPVKKVAVAAPKVEEAVKPVVKIKPLPAVELKQYREMLRNLRDRVVDEITFLAGDNLNRSQRESSGDLSSYSFHMADQGTDNFDREFALNLVSSEQDALYEIDEAIHRIDLGTYGSCEMCGCAIEKARLKALPFAKMCIQCKSESEKGKTRYRPFGATITQTPEA
ncbi:MAG: TraR/DksA C4-type zinc finger protein [Lentisphaerota bacterium]